MRYIPDCKYVVKIQHPDAASVLVFTIAFSKGAILQAHVSCTRLEAASPIFKVILWRNSSLVSVSGLDAPHWLGFQECCWVSTENSRIWSWEVNGLCIPLFFFTLAFGRGQQLSHLTEGTQSVDLIFVTVFFLCKWQCSPEQFSNHRICTQHGISKCAISWFEQESAVIEIVCKKRERGEWGERESFAPYYVTVVTPPPRNLGIHSLPPVRISKFLASFRSTYERV